MELGRIFEVRKWRISRNRSKDFESIGSRGSGRAENEITPSPWCFERSAVLGWESRSDWGSPVHRACSSFPRSLFSSLFSSLTSYLIRYARSPILAVNSGCYSSCLLLYCRGGCAPTLTNRDREMLKWKRVERPSLPSRLNMAFETPQCLFRSLLLCLSTLPLLLYNTLPPAKPEARQGIPPMAVSVSARWVRSAHAT